MRSTGCAAARLFVMAAVRLMYIVIEVVVVAVGMQSVSTSRAPGLPSINGGGAGVMKVTLQSSLEACGGFREGMLDVLYTGSVFRMSRSSAAYFVT